MTSPLTNKIKKLRLSRRLSQEGVARIIGLAGGYYCGVETGKRYAPSTVILQRLFSHLSLTDEEIREFIEAATLSPQKLRVPPDAPEEAFVLVAHLLRRWKEFTPDAFKQLTDIVKTFEVSPHAFPTSRSRPMNAS